MLASIVRWSATHRFIVIASWCLIAAVGVWTLPRQRVDALPDVSDTQVIVYANWAQPAELVEAQVTYPLTMALLGALQVKTVRGYTESGYALIYVIFDDGADFFRARQKVSEALSRTGSLLPADARVEIGPEATSVGWVFQYALIDSAGRRSLADLRALQDFQLQPALKATPGVAEVASVGGFEREYQVTVDPTFLEDNDISLKAVVEAVRKSNANAGARVIEFSDRRYTVRGLGLAHSIEDLERIVVHPDHPYKVEMGLAPAPVLLRDIAHVEAVPQTRWGIADLDGAGEVVGGIVVMRAGENASETVRRVKERLHAFERSLPAGVRIVTTYDRSDLIKRSLATFRNELLLAACVVALVIIISLQHFPSAIAAVAIIPATLLIAMGPMYWLGVNLNIMSLAAMVLSTGVLVDGAIIEVENSHRRLSMAGVAGDARPVLIEAMQEVVPAVFLSLLAIAVTFLPVFALTGQEGRLFRPMAAAKTIVMAAAAALSLTFAPALRSVFSRLNPIVFRPRWLASIANSMLVGAYRREGQSHLWRTLYAIYERVLRRVLLYPKTTIAIAIVLMAGTAPLYFRLGREWAPSLNEETLLYMPTTLPGIPVSEAAQLLHRQDAVLRGFPEVASVFGKAGRAATSTDPAPLNMIETTVVLKPREQWRERHRWYSGWSPEWLQDLLFRRFASDRITYDELLAEMNRATALPGLVNSWTMPVRGRAEMLTTGARTPLAVKVLGPDARAAERIARQVEARLKPVAGTRSVFAERAQEGYYLDIDVDRDKLAAYGLQMTDVQDVIHCAIGGAEATRLFDGRAQYPVTVRYPKKFRDSVAEIERITILNSSGEHVPLGAIAHIRPTRGPGMLRTEGAMFASYVYIDTDSDDIGTYVSKAQAVMNTIATPPGCWLEWAGEFENMLRAKAQLRIVAPATLALLIAVLYLNTKSFVRTGVVLLAVPFSLVGALWMMYALGYHVSIAAWVGMIALMGLDAETGVFMLLFIDLAYSAARRNNAVKTSAELKDAIIDGAAKRMRPKLMTVTAAVVGLLPTLVSTGTGSEIAKRIVAPMVGGLLASFALELLVYPAVYYLWKQPRPVSEPKSALAAKRHY